MDIGLFIFITLLVYGFEMICAKITKRKMTLEDFYSSFYFGVLGHAIYNSVFVG